jgi:predicted DNA-binding protein (UPF0251 family)
MEQIASLEDPYDPSDTAAVEVQLDTIATTFSQLRPRKPRKSTSQSQEELRDVLARLAEGGLVDAMAITIYDEIDNVIRLKDYEGYSDDYVSERLGALLSDLADELRPAIEKLQVEANQ